MDHIGLLPSVSSPDLYDGKETYKVLDDPHELRSKKVQLQAGVDNERDPSRADQRMPAIRRHARIGSEEHTLMTLLLKMFQQSGERTRYPVDTGQEVFYTFS